MFDRITVSPVTEEVTKNVHIRRAPTDESVRLLMEMEEAARKKLIATFKVSNNFISGKILFFREVTTIQLKYHILFELNGKKLEFSGNTDNIDMFKNQQEIGILFFKKISNSLTTLLIEENQETVIQALFKK